MTETTINRSYRDPTADAAIGKVRWWETVKNNNHQPRTAVASTPAVSTPNEATLRQAVLEQLNNLFPGERKKGERYRDSEFTRLRREIMHNNYDVFNPQEKGGAI